jgi:ureidoacrylate peracid hydrolase
MNFLTESELCEKRADWCMQLGLREDEPLQLRSPALLVLDMQNDFVSADGQLPVWGGPAAIPFIARLIDAFRRAHRPVFFTRHLCIEPYKHRKTLAVMSLIASPDTFLRDGHPGADIHEALQPSPDDIVVTKYRYSAFYDTPLGTLLTARNVSELVITGVATNICCDATAHDGFFRGFDVIFTVDGTGGIDEATHLATLRTIQLAYGRLTTVRQVLASLQGQPKNEN